MLIQNSNSAPISEVIANKEFFAVTPDHFWIYLKDSQSWHCLKIQSGVFAPLSVVLKQDNTIDLEIPNMQCAEGKWGHADTMEEIIAFFDSGKYLDWLADNS